MTRKKNRQQDPNESSDSGESNAGPSGSIINCGHIPKAVHLNVVKKKLKGGVRSSCDSCVKKSKIANIVPDAALSNEEGEIDENWRYWLCLSCAHIGCGRGQYKHALDHFNTPRSDKHDLVVDIDSWIVWCYSCEQKLAYNSTKKLQECVEYIKRHIQSSIKSDATSVDISSLVPIQPSEKISTTDSNTEKESTIGVNQKSSEAKVISNVAGIQNVTKPVKVRGLINLGNTCFYNSVLQCLSVTPYLTKILEKLTMSGEEFAIPANAESDDFEAPAVDGVLADSGPLSSELLSLLTSMRSPTGRADVLRPQELLKQVQNNFPQFRGHEQHDAHELLRHLLEGVRTDDLKRFQRVILRKYKLNGLREDDVADDMKKRMKFYGQKLQDLTLGVEGIFKGQLVSIVECQDCCNHSTRFESFLDLSLPVMEDKPLPPTRKKEQIESFAGDSGPSKHQLKKQKKAAKGKARSHKAKRDEKMEGCLTIFEENAKSADGVESEESDADVEDNVEQDSSTLVNGKEVGESGYSTDKHNTGESDGTSPSIAAINGDEHEGERIPGPSPGVSPIAAVSPAVSASPTASASVSPSAPASPTASASPCVLESPTGPVSSGGPTSPSTGPYISTDLLSQATTTALPASDWSEYYTPPGDSFANSVCNYNCNANGEMRCYTPVDEELRITIPENGEGSIHISPVNPSERPVSRCSYFPEEYHSFTRGRSGEPLKDFTPDLETKLLSLCLGENRRTNPEASQEEGNCMNEINYNNHVCSTDDNNDNNNDLCDLNRRQNLFQDDEECNGNNNETINSDETISTCQAENEALDGKESLAECNGLEKSAVVNSTDNPEIPLKTQHINDDDVSGWCKTLAPRHSTEDGECSVISCLNQFTSLELMMGNNKVGCDACTLRQNKGKEGKTVYTNSTKQLLISSPPPVLILHLKRFMMDNFRFKKLQRFVSFPLELDIAPFCSTKCRDSTSFSDTKTEVRYALYGVVEHTGSLNTGHYIAYIKIRTHLGENDPRWSFLPKAREFVYPNVECCLDTPPNLSGHIEDKWYSISDSRVVEIAESKVLKSQAYLLFYERVM